MTLTLPDRFADYPLRDRKRARTRLGLVSALLARLDARPLDEIGVDELCDEVGVSAGTFFNHFPTKADLLTHYVQLWSLRVGSLARDVGKDHDPLRAVDALFAATAAEVARHPRVMFEVLAWQARRPVAPPPPIERVERLLYLDDAPGVDQLSDAGLGALLGEWIGRAVAEGQLPPDTDVAAVTLAAASVFFGVPLLLGHTSPEQIGDGYARALALVWAGARAR
ncbi:MAG: TetR/AcrR family transcriptional regulator [Myxococcota bacterium]